MHVPLLRDPRSMLDALIYTGCPRIHTRYSVFMTDTQA